MPARLWFRINDVLPLAEHATACHTHRLSRAQVLAVAPLRPALVWVGKSQLDMLVSNGVPAWYTQLGSPHAAQAYTWRHIGSGRYGVAAGDGYDTAYLPLDTAVNQLPVIDVLREARHSKRRHWVSVDVDAADGHLIRPQRVRVVEHRDELTPDGATWMQARVTAATVAGHAYPALVADGYTTDAGHELPRFDRITVARMVADLHGLHANPDRHSDPMPGEYPLLRLHGDVLVVLEQHDDGTTERLVEADRVSPDAEGRYALGAYTWPWRLADVAGPLPCPPARRADP